MKILDSFWYQFFSGHFNLVNEGTTLLIVTVQLWLLSNIFMKTMVFPFYLQIVFIFTGIIQTEIIVSLLFETCLFKGLQSYKVILSLI